MHRCQIHSLAHSRHPGDALSRRRFNWSLALAAMGAPFSALAQEVFPSRPIRIVVPFSAGAPLDSLARGFAQQLARTLGVAVVVDNKPGAGMTIGAAEVARAKPDGYTILLANSDPLVTGPAVLRVPYDPAKDFQLISKLTVSKSGPILLASNAIKARTLPELLREAKSASTPISYASFGPGSYPQLIMETLSRESGARFTEIRYKGSPPAMQDLLANLIGLAFTSVDLAAPQVLAGRLHPIAVLDHAAAMPSVKTFADAGLKNFVFRNKLWLGLLAPAGTPDSVTQKLHAAVRTVAKDPAFIKLAADMGHDVIGGSPLEFEADYKTESAEILPLIRSLGIQPN